jgi:hypothetical protein
MRANLPLSNPFPPFFRSLFCFVFSVRQDKPG